MSSRNVEITQWTVNRALERSTHAPWGIFGGGNGAPGRFLHLAADGQPIAAARRHH
jgi:N-methylhydantoinase B/oxoprolinase/acetone carboxylase alpha subunit